MKIGNTKNKNKFIVSFHCTRSAKRKMLSLDFISILPLRPLGHEECSAAASAKAWGMFSLVDICFFNFVLCFRRRSVRAFISYIVIISKHRFNSESVKLWQSNWVRLVCGSLTQFTMITYRNTAASGPFTRMCEALAFFDLPKSPVPKSDETMRINLMI